MKIHQILALLGQAAPWDKSADWDPVGLQLGDLQHGRKGGRLS